MISQDQGAIRVWNNVLLFLSNMIFSSKMRLFGSQDCVNMATTISKWPQNSAISEIKLLYFTDLFYFTDFSLSHSLSAPSEARGLGFLKTYS